MSDVELKLDAVIVPAVKSPLTSRATIVEEAFALLVVTFETLIVIAEDPL